MRLTDAQIERYSRQILLREVGGTGQTALLAARVLVAGSGAAFETAATYLAGAGVGVLDVLSPGAPLPIETLAFAPVRSRNTDTRIRTVPRDAAIALDAYDVVLALGDEALATARGVTGRPVRGSVVLHAGAAERVALSIVPAGRGCVACVEHDPPQASRNSGADDVASHASAGALAALAACRWLLGLAGEAEPRRLALGDDDVAWVEEPVRTLVSCPRGCPPRTQPV